MCVTSWIAHICNLQTLTNLQGRVKSLTLLDGEECTDISSLGFGQTQQQLTGKAQGTDAMFFPDHAWSHCCAEILFSCLLALPSIRGQWHQANTACQVAIRLCDFSASDCLTTFLICTASIA